MSTLGLPKKGTVDSTDSADKEVHKPNELDILKEQIAKLQAQLADKASDQDEKPDIEYVQIHMDLSPSAGGAINHAGRMYVNGHSYKVDVNVARDLMEIQNRGWSHESSLQNSENMGRRKLAQRI